MQRDSFVFRKEWREAISNLPEDVRLEFYESVIEYGLTGEIPPMGQMTTLAFNFVKYTLDRDAERYEDTKRKRSEAGKKHKGNQYTKKNGTNGTNVPTLEQMEQNGTNGTDSVYVSVYGLSKDNKKKKPTNVGKKEETDVSTLTEERKRVFYESLIPYVGQYGKDMVRDFFNYWTEMNKSRSKMRFEQQPTWETSKRLATWSRKDNSYNHESNRKDNGAEQTVAAATEAIAELLADNR